MEELKTYVPPSEADARYIATTLWRGKWIILLGVTLCLGLAVLVTAKMSYVWRSNAQMILVQRGTAVVEPNTLNPQNSLMGYQGAISYNGPALETVETQVAMIESDGMVKRTFNWLKNYAMTNKEQSLEKSLEENGINDPVLFQFNFPRIFKISSPKDTGLIEVTADADTPEHASLFANAVCQAFVQWKKELAVQGVKELTSNLEVRAARAKADMLKAEKAETAFKQNHHMVDIPTQEKAALDEYLQRNAEVAVAKQELTSQEARLAALGDRLKTTNEAIKNGTGVRDDALVLSLQTQLHQIEMDRVKAAQEYTPAYPGVLPELDARIKDVKDRLAKAIQGTVDNKKPSLQAQEALTEDYRQAKVTVLYDRAKLAALVAQRDQLKSQTVGLPQVGMQYARLAQDSELARSLYANLQAELNSARFNRDTATGNVQITQEAVPDVLPVRPRPLINLLVGGLAGLFLSVASVMLLSYSDRKVRTLQDVRRLVPGPIIGMVPKMSRAQSRRLAQGTISAPVLEAYNQARANLTVALRYVDQASPDKQILLITSALPGEGKSTTVANLARSIALSGKQVILVDADMRRPSQNRLFNTEEPNGLADVLAGKLSLEEALVDSGIANLTILHSGHPSRDPSDLLCSSRLTETLDALRKEADVVLVDTPASDVAADAFLLAPFVDCIIQVIGAEVVDEDALLDTMEAFGDTNPKAMLFFVNRAGKGRGYRGRAYYSYRRQIAAYQRQDLMPYESPQE